MPELFNEVPKRDVVTWNAMIAGYVLKGEQELAMDMFEEMRHAREPPEAVTMLSVVSACADSGALDIGEKLHCFLLEMLELEHYNWQCTYRHVCKVWEH